MAFGFWNWIYGTVSGHSCNGVYGVKAPRPVAGYIFRTSRCNSNVNCGWSFSERGDEDDTLALGIPGQPDASRRHIKPSDVHTSSSRNQHMRMQGIQMIAEFVLHRDHSFNISIFSVYGKSSEIRHEILAPQLR